MTTHTHGPYVVVEDGDLVEVSTEDGVSLAKVYRSDRRLANARLFAAGPDLLDFAVELAQYVDSPHLLPPAAEIIAMARACIAKVEGK